MTPQGIAWGAGGRRSPRPSPRPRSGLRRVVAAFVWVLCGACAVGVYTNVVTEAPALQQRTESLAREHAGCGDACRVARMEGRRSILDYRADYEIDGVGTVRVTCRRRAVVVGEHRCTVR